MRTSLSFRSDTLKTEIGILGGGSWGTALATVLGNKGYAVDIWMRNKEQCKDMQESRENKKYLPKVKLSENINITTDIEKTIKGKVAVILAVPTHTVRMVLEANKEYFSAEQVIVNVAKGIENDTLERISEIVKDILPANKFVALSGPSHAEEVGVNDPTTVIAASTDEEAGKLIQDIFMTENFRVYTNNDVIGVELGGALKNVIALGAGISDGLEFGDNAKAALMNRGIFEMARLGVAMGANFNTFLGLSGIGDLIVTCTSMHSRNRRAGILIGEGLTVDEAIEKTGMVVEGIKTTKSAYELSKKYKVNMPITEEIYRLLYVGGDVKESVKSLMNRDKKSEMDDFLENELYK